MTTITDTQVLDKNGQVILAGSIVGMAPDEDGYKSKTQGLVVLPYSNIEDEEYTVPVYFDREVNEFSFFSNEKKEIMSSFEWDSEHAKKVRESDYSLLLLGDLWKRSPRIRFFKPSELVVESMWSFKNLVSRIFKDSHHTINIFKFAGPPNLYQCWIKGCTTPANKQTIFNCWGSVYCIFTCTECFGKFNGKCGDVVPDLNIPPKYLDGTLAKVEEGVKV